MWMWEAVWDGRQPQPWHNDIILTPQVTQNLKIWAKKCGYNSLRLLPYTHWQHMNVLKHRKQFELSVSLNHDIMSSFWLHMWPSNPKPDPCSVSVTIWGYCHMPMDSISMSSNTLYMYDVVAGSSLILPSASTIMYIILTPQVTQNPKIWPK